MNKTQNINKIFDFLNALTFLEINELILELEKRFSLENNNLSLTTIQNTNIVPSLIISEVQDEKIFFDIILESAPLEKKVPLVKVVRTLTGLSLNESKDIVYNVPKLLKKDVTKEESEKIKKEIEMAGGTISLK